MRRIFSPLTGLLSLLDCVEDNFNDEKNHSSDGIYDIYIYIYGWSDNVFMLLS